MGNKKNRGGSGSVPPGNRPQRGSGGGDAGRQGQDAPAQSPAEVPAQEQDPKRRLGDFTGTGEHSIQQPGGHNGANH